MAEKSKPRSPSKTRQTPPKKAKTAAGTSSRRPKRKLKRVRPAIYSEFRPDNTNVSPFKVLRFTRQQRLELLRWLLYVAVCVLALVIQDTIMSRITLLGTTTDLAVGAMLLITVLEGSEVGSVFILIASMIYYFSGSAPGPYSVGLLTTFGLLATLFRQKLWHRSSGSIILCAALAVIAYELGVYLAGMFLGLTQWYRLPRFFFMGVFTILAMIPMYHLIHRIGQIGGYVWKE